MRVNLENNVTSRVLMLNGHAFKRTENCRRLSVTTIQDFKNTVERERQEAQLPLRNKASAMYFFVAKLLSIAEMTYS